MNRFFRSARLGGHLAAGGGWLLLGLFFWYFAAEIPKAGLAGDSDPGPRWVPVILSAGLMIGGAIEAVGACVVAWRRRRDPPPDAAPAGETRSSRWDWAPAIVFGGMVLYLAGLAVLGFWLPTVVFLAAWSRAFGRPWWQTALVATSIPILILIVFGQVFEVQLPAGYASLRGAWLPLEIP